MIPTDDRSLENKTQVYWGLSRVWNGQNVQMITTETALAMTNSLVSNLGIHRPLSRRVGQLTRAIVHGKYLPEDLPQRSA